MKILYITSKPIFPTVDGGCVAMERFLASLLFAEIEVKHLQIETAKHPFNAEAYPKDLYDQTKPEAVFVNTNVTIPGALLHLFKSGSYNVNRFYNSSMLQLILNTLETQKFDAIILESLFTSSYLKQIKTVFKGPTFIRTHNVEFDLWKGYANDAKGLKRWYLKKLARDIKVCELQTLEAVDGVLSISSDDSQVFQTDGITTPIYDVPVAVSIPKLVHNYEHNEPYHIGSMDWIPNQEAVHKLIMLMPEIRLRAPKTRLHIAGLNAHDFLSTDELLGIYVHGFVEHINLFGSAHGILVSPIQSGSGIRIKILEAMAIGIPTLTTTIGAQGIRHQETNCLLIADTDADFIDTVVRLITDQALRQEIGQNAIDYIRKNHNIEAVSKQISEILKST